MPTYTNTTVETLTLTHARELASRVAADMRQFSRFYGKLDPARIPDYEQELMMLLKAGYLATYEFGLKRDGERVVTFYYEVGPGGDLVGGSPGGIFPQADDQGAAYFNFVTYSEKWEQLDDDRRVKFKRDLPLTRTAGQSPNDGNGYWVESDRQYAAGGTMLTRKTFRPN